MRDLDVHASGIAVPNGVGDAFLGDAEQGGLGRFGRRFGCLLHNDVELGLRAYAAPKLRQLPERDGEVSGSGRAVAQPAQQTADGALKIGGRAFKGLQGAVDGRRVACVLLHAGSCRERSDAKEQWADLVVQVARQLGALLLGKAV